MQKSLTKIVNFKDGHRVEEVIQVVTEQPVTLSINNENWLTFRCTPSDLDALGVGFLYNEGIIDSFEEITYLRVCEGADHIDIWLNKPIVKPDIWFRTSGCSGGVTGINESNLPAELVSVKNGTPISPAKVERLMNDLYKSQGLYRKSGGVHSSVLYDGTKAVFSAEDIGRHNTLDKLAGKILMEKVDARNWIILTTGRVSSEMIQKAGRMEASMVISRTSPTSISVLMAEKMGICLIGYARHNQFTIYSHPERVFAIEK